ncbi:MAG TPA: DUF2752 domain-containing protein [Fimbriimonadaceae bacterium]|jgi:hypothetical protein
MIRFEKAESRKHLVGQFLWFLLWVFVTSCAIYLTPSTEGHGTHTQLGLPPCPSVMLLGRPCPGCGLTTSFTAFVHGQIGFAFHAHPFGPILYLLFTASALCCLYGFVKGYYLDFSSKSFNRVGMAFMVVFLGFGLIRFCIDSHYGDTDVYHQMIVKGTKASQ